MNALQKIKAGITSGNWQLVAEGYEDLTGESVPVTNGVLDKNAARDYLNQLIDLDTGGNTIVPSKKTVKTKQPKKTKTPPAASSSSSPSSQMIFYSGDDIPNDALVEKLTQQQAAAKTQKATRQPFVQKEVACDKCGKMIKESAISKTRLDDGDPRYWCQKCI